MKPSRNPLDIPTYPPTTAARLVSLRPERVTRWLQGYEYTYTPSGAAEPVRTRQKPVVKRKGAAGQRDASFLDLIDLLFVKQFLERGFSLQRLRAALGEAERFIGTGGYHFAQKHFWTDGSNIYIEARGRGDALMQLLSGGQWAIAPIIKQVAQELEFDEVTGFAKKWYPLGRARPVVVDPEVSFGAPTVTGRGIETANVFDLFLGEGKHVTRVSAWLDILPVEVETAVEFERRLANAA